MADGVSPAGRCPAATPFQVRVAVRGYELDTNGHLNQAVYLQYAEHARWSCVRAAGISREKLLAAGVGPVILETTVRFHRELRDGDEVDVSCLFLWGDRKIFRFSQEMRRVDGKVAATFAGVLGLLDLDKRQLALNPREIFRSLASAPEIVNL